MFKYITQAFSSRNILITLLFGFSSAIPLALTSSTLKAWFSTSSVSLSAIGFITVISLPYTFKFLWAPVLDRFIPPFLGRRRGWILIFECVLGLLLMSMSLFSPETNPYVLMFLAFLVAFFSASADIAIDAYRTDLLSANERALGAAMAVNGYRIGMLVSGGLALIFAEYLGWSISYAIMGLLMTIGALGSWFGPEPKIVQNTPKTFKDCTVLPFKEFLSRPKAVWILLFVVLYKFGDAFAGALIPTFLIREAKMSLVEIGSLIKLAGFFATIFGTTLGALWISKLGWYRALIIFGILQAITNLFYLPIVWVGPSFFLAAFAIFMENFTAGMATAAFMGFLMSLCDARFTAFQYALLSSLSMVGRVFIGPVAAFIAERYGWQNYFISSLFFSIPGLLLIGTLKGGLEFMTAELKKANEKLAASA